MKYDLNNMEAVEIYKLVLNRNIKRFPAGFWQRPEAEQNAIKVAKYLIEDILHYTEEDIKTKVNSDTLKCNKLYGMRNAVFSDSTYKCINKVYPNKFKEWELSSVPQNFWNRDTAIDATKWLLEEKLKYTEDDIKNKVNTYTFKDNGLYGMINMIFDGSVFKCIDNAYPDRFKEWELHTVPKNFWSKETAKGATKWLLEEKLHYTEENIKTKVNYTTFKNNGLQPMLVTVFECNVKKCLKFVYSELFKDKK